MQDILSGAAVESWADVQKIVRAGQAAKYFSVGDQFVCEKAKFDGTSERLVWDIIGIDHDAPSDPQFTHSITLQLHELYKNIPFLSFMAKEAFVHFGINTIIRFEVHRKYILL